MNNRILKRILMIISMISLSIVISVIPAIVSVYSSNLGLWTSYMHQEKKLIETDFYKSNVFEFRVLRPIAYWIGETTDSIEDEEMIQNYIDSNTRTEYHEYEDENGNYSSTEETIIPSREVAIKEIKNNIEYSKNQIKYHSQGMKYIAINKESNITYSNTDNKTLEEFKTNIDGYVDIEIHKTPQNNSYIKDINGKILKNTSDAEHKILNSIEKENIEIYISFPQKMESGSALAIDISTYNSSVKYTQILTILLLINVVVFLLATILYKLVKGEVIKKEGIFVKIINKIPLELWAIGMGIVIILSIELLGYYGYVDYFRMICGFIGIFIIIVSLYLLQYMYKNNKLGLFKNTITYFVYRLTKNSIKMFLISCKKIPLIKNIIAISIVITMLSLAIGFIMVLFGFGYIGAGIPIFIAMTLFTWYIVKKLSYLAKIMEGAEKIKNGDLHYKIDIEGYNSFTDLADNINNIGEGLEKSIDKQLKSERLRSELITNVSHDLKTPLTSIINYIELIKDEDDIQPEVLKDYVNVLDTKSKRLKSLIEDLFEASKASSGNIDLNMDNIDIKQLLNQSVGELEEKLKSSNLELKVNVPKEKIYIYADGRRMFRVFENLLSNIAKYSLPNTRVYIDIVEENENIKLTMKNISSYELNFDASEITERFKRGDESRNTEGSGLGLAIAKDLVRLQNGKFDIDIDGDLFKVKIQFKRSNKQS